MLFRSARIILLIYVFIALYLLLNVISTVYVVSLEVAVDGNSASTAIPRPTALRRVRSGPLPRSIPGSDEPSRPVPGGTKSPWIRIEPWASVVNQYFPYGIIKEITLSFDLEALIRHLAIFCHSRSCSGKLTTYLRA